MSFLFMNEKDIDDLFDEIEEESVWINSSNNNSKDNKEKKQPVLDRIIKRCELVQRGGLLALDLHPYVGPVKNAMEFITGKEFITNKKLNLKERAKRAPGVITGIGTGIKYLDNVLNLVDQANLVNDVLELNKDIDEQKERKREYDRIKNMNKNNSRNRSRSRSRSRNRTINQNSNNKGRSRKTQQKKK